MSDEPPVPGSPAALGKAPVEETKPYTPPSKVSTADLGAAARGKGTAPSQMPPPLKIRPGESIGDFAKRQDEEKKKRNTAVQREALK